MPNLLYELISRIGQNKPLQKLTHTNGVVEGDEPYLKQFLGDGQLMPTTDRPTHLTQHDNLPWYKPAVQYSFPIGHGQDEYDTNFDFATDAQINGVKKGDVLDLGYRNTPGLGHMKVSVGRDDTGPYASIYDTYDFANSPTVHPLVGKILGMLGSPYHVYDRRPLTHLGKDVWTAEPAGDIELPLDTPVSSHDTGLDKLLNRMMPSHRGGQ